MESLRARVLIASGVLIAGTTLLTGCFPSPGDIIGGIVAGGVTEGIEDATGVDLNAETLPEGFPASIPVPDGDIVFSLSDPSGAGSGWSVTWTSPWDATMVKTALEAAGYTFPDGLTPSLDGQEAYLAMSNDEYMIVVLIGREDGASESSITYTVVPAQE